MLFKKVVKGVFKLKRVTIVLFVLILVAGCSFSKVYTDAIEETEEHLNNEEFDQALKTVKIALNEKKEDDVALNIKSGLLKYKELTQQQEKRNWENVTDVINSFGTLDSVHPKLKKQVDEINKQMLIETNLETELAEGLEQVKSDLDNSLFEEANTLLNSFETNEEFKFAEKEINIARKEYDQQFETFKEKEKTADRNKELKELSVKYEKKLTKTQKMEDNMKVLKKGDSSEKFIQALVDTEVAYDKILNQIYKLIIKEYPKEEDKIREEQRTWLSNYEEDVNEIRYKSGEYDAMEFSVQSKKERTKKLLNEYLK